MILDELTYEQCMAQGVGPLVFPKRLEQGLDPANSVRMKTVCMQNMQEQVKMRYTLEKAWQALEDAGIEPVLMKGAGLAALYPEPHMRQWGDIDVFVGKEQYHPACAAMREAFPKALKFDEELDHYKHYNLIADGVSIEVHRVTMALTHPIDKRRYAKMEEYGKVNGIRCTVYGVQCKVDGEEGTVKVFEPTFNALFVFMHSWEHMMTNGASLRQLCDVSLLLHHYADRIDRKRLGRWLRALHLTEVWQLYMAICVRHLGLQETEAPFYSMDERIVKNADQLLKALLEGRMREIRSIDSAPAKNRFVRKWCTMKLRMRNADRIGQFSPAYARHLRAGIILSGLGRLFAKDRHWE